MKRNVTKAKSTSFRGCISILGREANHPRSRERYLALYMIGRGQMNATQWAAEIGRENQTVMGWVHRYNAAGPEGVAYQHSGGRTPFLPKVSKLKLSQL